MKKHQLIGILVTIIFFLAGCNPHYVPPAPKNPIKETWMNHVQTNSDNWIRNSDIWFLTGDQNELEQYSQNAPFDAAITTMTVRVPDFSQIKVDGQFQVQIIGQQDHNSIYIIGPNDQTRETGVDVQGNTLFVHQSANAKTQCNKVIVRIGVGNLKKLIHCGTGVILGRNISSNGLVINSLSSGTVTLNGNMNVQQINQTGTGTITVLGANTPNLKISVKGDGCVNLKGRVGVRSITHNGNGDINIIGADSDGLIITASGAGKTGIAGHVNLQQITAIDHSRVYVYWVNSRDVKVFECSEAHVGLAGAARNLNVQMRDGSRFDGQYLWTSHAVVKTQEAAIANVFAEKQLFAVALDYSQIYYFGSPQDVSKIVKEDAVILPILDVNATKLPIRVVRKMCCPPPKVLVRRGFKDE